MRSEIVGRMLRFCLDGELLRASASGFLECSGMPFLREVAVFRSRSLADAIVDPARVWFPLMEGRVNEEGKGGGRMISHTSKFSYETLQFSDPVPKFGDFVDVWVVTDRGIIDLVDAETGLMRESGG
jgi:hypothetical protein